jgi:hypothetical protein
MMISSTVPYIYYNNSTVSIIVASIRDHNNSTVSIIVASIRDHNNSIGTYNSGMSPRPTIIVVLIRSIFLFC